MPLGDFVQPGTIPKPNTKLTGGVGRWVGGGGRVVYSAHQPAPDLSSIDLVDYIALGISQDQSPLSNRLAREAI